MTKKKLIGLLCAFVVLFIFLVLPPLGAVTPLGMKTVGVLIFTIILWISEPVPIGVTCFLTLAMWVAVGALSYKDSFAYLGHYINLFLIGSFGIAGALYTTGAARRYALTMLNIPWVRRNSYMLIMNNSLLLSPHTPQDRANHAGSQVTKLAFVTWKTASTLATRLACAPPQQVSMLLRLG